MRAAIAVVLVAAICGVGDVARAQGTRPVIAAGVYNYAAVPVRVLAEAEADAASIFRAAGIDVVWVDPLLRPATLHVHLLSPRMTARTQTTREVLGLATTRSAMAYVLYDRVVEKATLLNVRTSRLLAFVMAHEMGHVLLAGRAHGDVGVMRPRLDPDVLRRGLLGFTRDEGRRMRASYLRK